jgi:AraC-like DNA-binding protein
MANLSEFRSLLKKDYELLAEGHVLDAQYFYFETHPDYDRELAIVFGGYERCACDFEIRRRTYPYYVLEYGIRGNCTLKISVTSHIIKNGVIAGFAPGNPHHYRCDPNSPLEHYWLAFVGTKAKELFEKGTLLSKGSVRGSPNTMQLMQAIITHGIQKMPYAQEICSSFLRILLLSLPNNPDPEQQLTSTATASYQTCRRYIDENFSYITSPSQVADACGINVRYMSRLFKKYNTITPQEYITRLKLNKAVNLLLTSDLPVCKIALAVGFEDPYHFSRNFKQFHDTAPNHYRQMHMM